MKIYSFEEFITESLPRKQAVDQLKKVDKIIQKEIGGDIGDKIPDMMKQGANIHYIHNPIDTGIETYEDSLKNSDIKYTQKDFDSKNPMNNQKKPATNYIYPQTLSKKKKAKS